MEFKLSFEPWSWSLTKVRVKQLEQSASILRERKIDTQPSPVPNSLRQREIYLQSTQSKVIALKPYAQELDQLAERFISYQANNEKVTSHRIEDWLLQFAAENIPSAVTVLQHVRFWDRTSITDTFADALADWSDQVHDCQWVPLK